MFPVPDEDLATSRRLGQQFYVSARSARGRRWERLSDFSDLAEAFAFATGRANLHFEVGIFRDGFVYWTSQDPDLFNSTVVQRANVQASMPPILVRCYFARDAPSGAGEVARTSPADWAAAALARVANVLSVREPGPYWKMPELDEVTIGLELEGGDARERVCKALAQEGWNYNGNGDAVWNRRTDAHADDERLVWANVMMLPRRS